MKTIVIPAALAGALLAPAAWCACEMPSLVASIPDGATATEEQLLSVQQEVKAYIAAMDAYIACQNEEIAANDATASSEFLYLMSSRIESARSEVDAVATRFNDQVNAYRAARDARAPGLP